MDHHINPTKAGLAVGTLMGGLHIVWSLLILFGWAQGLVNFSMWAHMVSVPFAVKAFDFSAAVMVVVVAAIIGYIIGFVFARIWNRMHHS